MNVVFPDQDIFAEYPSAKQDIYEFGRAVSIKAYSDKPCEFAERCERLKDADVIVFGVYKFEKDILEKLPRLRMLQFMGTGYANFIDMEYCKKKDIIVRGTDNYGSNAVAEYTIAQVFTIARHTALADSYMKSGRWIYDGLEGQEIASATYGIVGTGSIGRLVAQKATALGARVIANDVFESEELKTKCHVSYVSLEELFSTSDIISIHAKYTPQTAGLISKKLINIMKPNALFVNCSRAEIVDYDALVNALTDNKIRGAALDVFYEEPLSNFTACKLPNLICSPHIGYFTDKSKTNCLRMCIESVIKEMHIY